MFICDDTHHPNAIFKTGPQVTNVMLAGDPMPPGTVLVNPGLVYLALSTYNTEFVALAVSMMNLVEKVFLLCEWLSFGLSALLFRLG